MPDSSQNPDYSGLSKEQLENLLRQPNLPEPERVKTEDELTKRIRDELWQLTQGKAPPPPPPRRSSKPPRRIPPRDSVKVVKSTSRTENSSDSGGWVTMVVILIIIVFLISKCK